MRKTFAVLLVVAPLLAGCGKDGEPIIPELKGRWDVISLHKMPRGTVGQSSAPQRVSNASQSTNGDNCNVAYVTFTKQGIVMRTLGIPLNVFPLTEARRENQRLILMAGKDIRIDLLMRNGELRFDDIYDGRGRSVKYERLPDDHAFRRKGATTLGEAFEQFLNLKPCKA